MRKEKDWDLEEKKERRRWFWTAVVFAVGIAYFIGHPYYKKYTETTVIEMIDIFTNNFSESSYTEVTISFYPYYNSRQRKEVKLSEEEISSLMSLLRNTYIKGTKDNDFLQQISFQESYLVELRDRTGFFNSIVLFIKRDETSKKTILSTMASNRNIADIYVVEGEELYNMITNKFEKALPD